VTEVVRVDPTRPSPELLESAGRRLREGELVAFPTETVYGLGADATQADAVRSVFVTKGRPSTDPLIVHVVDEAAAREVVADWPDAAGRLARRFWPGPLTLVLPRGGMVVPTVGGGRPTVAVRVPAHPVALGLLRAAGVPVAAPSANRFGRISPTEGAHVVEELGGSVPVVLDAGPTPLGVESTVVDLTGERPALLRPGALTLEDLEGELGPLEHRERRVIAADAPAASPGQLSAHYAPSTPVVLVEADGSTVDALRAALAATGHRAEVLALPDTAARAAVELYASLRRADRPDLDVLVVRAFPGAGMGRAVNDRLFRAAHGRVALDADPGTVERLLRSLPRP
jgi:L-threonylcarbamoyladenylate synthase